MKESKILQETIDTVNQLAPFSQKQGLPNNPSMGPALLRGYLMQPLSRGRQARVALMKRSGIYRMFKIDLAGVIYLNYPDVESQFQLRFIRQGDTWFDTEVLSIADLTIGALLEAITNAAPAGELPIEAMTGCLGHPTQHTLIVRNDDLYPEPPEDYAEGDMIDSLIGSWIFGIHRSKLPDDDTDFDVNLLFTVTGDEPVQLIGPSVMTITEIHDVPVGTSVLATDVMDIQSPTPLVGGSLVVLGPFDDVGYGVIAATPRPMFREQEWEG